MIERALLLALLLFALPARSEQTADADGFTRPLDQLQFNPYLNQREFERSSLDMLQVYDPWEPWNRRVYHFNHRFDEWLLLPLLKGYRKVTPRPLRSGVSNVFANLGDVGNLLNSLLQFKPKRSLQTGSRLLINTTVGIVGLWDPASRFGLPRQPEDFGQTLGFYGVPDGPYLVLPLLGPSNLRDSAGTALDFGVEYRIDFLGAASLANQNPELNLLRAINQRHITPFRYGELNSPFEYEKVRFLYREMRRLRIQE